MGNEIAHLILTVYKIFVGKGALPPYNPRQGASPLDRTPRSQTVLPTIQNGMTPMRRCEQRGGRGPGPHFWWQSGEFHSGEFKICGSMESLVIGTNWEIITKLCEFYPLKRAFKHCNPWASRGSAPWTPGAMMESPMKIVQS